MISPSLQARTHTIAIFFDFFSIFSCISYNVLFFFVLFKCSFFRLKLIDFPVLPLYQINSLFYIFFSVYRTARYFVSLIEETLCFFFAASVYFSRPTKNAFTVCQKKKNRSKLRKHLYIRVFFLV